MAIRINAGVWNRRIPRRWITDGCGRTDIFKTVLAASRLQQCRFEFEDGPTVVIPAEELRRVLVGGRDHYGRKIWGPFTIDPRQQTVEGEKVQMQVI